MAEKKKNLKVRKFGAQGGRDQHVVTVQSLIDPNADARARRRFIGALQTVNARVAGPGRQQVQVVEYNTRMQVLLRRLDTDNRASNQMLSDIIEGRPVKPQRNNYRRYFQIDIDNIPAGHSIGYIGKQIHRKILDANGIDEYNEDEEDDLLDYKFEVVRVGYSFSGRRATGLTKLSRRYAPEVNIDDADIEEADRQAQQEQDFARDFNNEVDDFDDDDLSGLHKYQAMPLEEKFSIKPLQMPDFPCVYESLMIIKWTTENSNNQPNISLPEWKMYVLIHFNSEDMNTQQIFYEGWVLKGVQFFEQKYKIKVGLFNACLYDRELQKLDILQQENIALVPKYFLVYWSEHVFPCRRENLEMLAEVQHQFIQKINRTNKQEQTFIMYPPILNVLHLEFKCSILQQGQHNRHGEYLFEQLQINPALVYVLPFFLRKGERNHNSQVQAVLRYNQLREHSLEEMYNIASEEMDMQNKSEQNIQKMVGKLNILKQQQSTIYFTQTELNHYNTLKSLYYNFRSEYPDAPEDDCIELEQQMVKENEIARYAQHRRFQYQKLGVAVLDIETYMDNDPDRQTIYNMVPFCATLFGRLQKKVQRVTVRKRETDNKRHDETVITQMVELVEVNETFFGFHPRECLKKLIFFLMDNNFCYTQHDYTVLAEEKRDKPKRLMNYIFAHNGFGFDYKFLYEQLMQQMKEFNIVGDIGQTKQLRGNGLNFLDFSLIYREKLSDLAKTFFPRDYGMHKFDCDLVIGLQKQTLKEWFEECEQKQIKLLEHKQIGEIARYCMQDSRVLFSIVNKFFSTAYSTPFGHGFLPKPFYHSLSSMAYNMFVNCYLKKAIFVNRHSLDIELKTKLGGCTGANSNCFGIGVSIDENSFYPAAMQNEMPVEYEIANLDQNPFEVLQEPFILTSDSIEYFDIRPYNIYCVTYRFPEGTVLPVIQERTRDTMVMVLESEDFDELNQFATAKSVYLYGYQLIVAIQDIPGTIIRVYGMIRFKAGDFIFKEFILDQYSLRLQCKAAGDTVGDKFHKNIMNSAQGKIGQKAYENIMFGSAASIRDATQIMTMRDDIQNFEFKQILSDQIDLFELKWEQYGDKWTQSGNTVRLPAYIMSIARTQLMRVQNVIARTYGSPHVIAYYDTDSIFTRFDLTNPNANTRVQTLFDIIITNEPIFKDMNVVLKCFFLYFKHLLIQKIGDIISETPEMKMLQEIEVQDVCNLHENSKTRLLDENRLGACKIEKYVIRGIALGAKQYGVYYLERDSKRQQWQLKVAVRLKGVRANARKMEMMDDINDQMINYHLKGDMSALPLAVTPLMTKWSRMGAGVILSDMVKIVRPTLSKRIHNFADGTSVPFKTIKDFQLAKNQYEQLAEQQKKLFRNTFTELAEQISSRPEYIALQEANQLQYKLRDQAKNFFTDAIKQLTESRKRYMLRIARIKYDQLQDKILDLFLGERRKELWMLASNHLPKMESIAYHAVIKRRTHSKKSLYTMKDDKMQFTDMDAARVIAYMLFIHYVLQSVFQFTDIPKNFSTVCEHLVDQFMLTLFEMRPPKRSKNNNVDVSRDLTVPFKNLHRWNYAIVYGYEFLQSGLCLYKSGTESASKDAPLSQRMKYTTLWRFMNNLQNHLYMIGQAGQMGSIDTTQFERYFDIDKEVLQIDDIRGPCFAHHLLVNDIQKPVYDLYNLKAQDDNQNDVLLDHMVESKKRITEQKFNDEIDGTFIQPQLFQQVRRAPVYQFGKTKGQELELLADQWQDDTEKQIAKMLLMSEQVHRHNLIDIEEMENLNIRKIYEILTHHFKLQNFSQDTLQRIFSLTTRTNEQIKNQASKEDLIDMVMLLMFLNYGQRDAAILMLNVHRELEQVLLKEKAYHKKFIRVCRTIFCNQHMFTVYARMNRLSKGAMDFIKSLIEITIDIDLTTYPNNESFKRRLIDIVTDKRTSPLIAQIFDAINSIQELKELSQRLFQKILRWRNPPMQDIVILKSILLMERNIHGDNQAQTEVLIKNDLEQFVLNIDQQQQQIFNDIQFEGHYDNEISYSQQSFNLYDNESVQLQYKKIEEAHNFADQIQQDLSVDQYLVQCQKVMNQDIDEQNDWDNSREFVQLDSILGKRQRWMKSRFFDIEAEEASQDESSSEIICTSTIKKQKK